MALLTCAVFSCACAAPANLAVLAPSMATAAPRVNQDVARITADGVLGTAKGIFGTATGFVGAAGGLLGSGVGKVLGVAGKLCGLAGAVPTAVGKACKVASLAGPLVSGAQGLLGGSGSSLAKKALTAAGLAAVGLWAAHGAKAALHELAHVIGATTNPEVRSGWFSGPYWRVASLSFLLTLPFLFAAAIQALVRSDLGLLVSAVFGYLPLSILAVCIAQPLTALLLSASDAMSGAVNAAGSGGDTHFLAELGAYTGGLSGFAGSAFLGLLLAIVIVSAAIALTLELLAREAAVYVVLLMLPLTFAAMVWPARRVWALRTVEVLVALILAKFVIVAILTLSESAFGHLSENGVGTLMAGMTLLILAAFSPWVLIRLIPFSEVAAGIGGAIQQERSRLITHASSANAIDAMWAESRMADAEPFEQEIPATPDVQPRLPPGGGDSPGADPSGGGPSGGDPSGGRPGGGPSPGGSAPGGGPAAGDGSVATAGMPSIDGIPGGPGTGGRPRVEPGAPPDGAEPLPPDPGEPVRPEPAEPAAPNPAQPNPALGGAATTGVIDALREHAGGPDEPLVLGPDRQPSEDGPL
jgi:hypothetical protein